MAKCRHVLLAFKSTRWQLEQMTETGSFKSFIILLLFLLNMAQFKRFQRPRQQRRRPARLPFEEEEEQFGAESRRDQVKSGRATVRMDCSGARTQLIVAAKLPALVATQSSISQLKLNPFACII